MIQANELRLGNYVNHNNFKVPMMVSGLILEDRRCRVAVIGSNSTLMCGGYWSAIPLTEQWLIDFGFEKNLVEYQKELLTIKNDFTINCLGSWRIEIKHVHQLQNLYFALTGKELNKQ